MREQHEQSAGDRKILLEMQKLVAVAELGVEQHSRCNTEAGERKRSDARLIADQDQEPAPDLDRDGEGQQEARNPVCGHVGKRQLVASELAPGLMQEQRRQQDAASERARINSVISPRHALGLLAHALDTAVTQGTRPLFPADDAGPLGRCGGQACGIEGPRPSLYSIRISYRSAKLMRSQSYE